MMQTRPMPTEAEVQAYIASLPVDDEPVTEEERLAVEEGRADVAAGRVYTTEQMVRELAAARAAEQAGK